MPPSRPGALVLVVGPSGVGKDTLLNGARAALADDASIVFARRIVTRAAVVELEDHDTLDEAAFREAEARGDFALTWRANDLAYALPKSILSEIGAGKTVVANISRKAIPEAEALAAHVLVAHVTAAPQVRAARLAGRGRETAEAIAERLAREVPLVTQKASLVDVVNEGSIEAGVAALVAAIHRARATSA
jgi:ribose 1,5-bisphosphokinase